jgi:hypothetical protein
LKFVSNKWENIYIEEDTGAPFTTGDGTTGRDVYIANNIITGQTRGVPPGIFASAGNTVVENNCFTSGFQARPYYADDASHNVRIFEGVTVRNNII